MIRVLFVVIFILVIAMPVVAQEETLINGEIQSGGFGGPVVKIGPMNGTTGVFVGGWGGWIINHTFSIGGAGYGLVNNIKISDPSGTGRTTYLNFGYGGLDLEYIGNSMNLIHYTLGVLIGGGGISYRDSIYQNYSEKNTNAVFVLEPSANIEMNVTKFFRIDIGASYRWVNDVQFDGLKDKDMSGLSGMLTLKFGTF